MSKITIAVPDDGSTDAEEACGKSKTRLSMIVDFLVKTPDDYKSAVETAVFIRRESKRLKEVRDHILTPLKEAVKRINALFAPAIKDYDTCENHIKNQLVGYREYSREAIAAWSDQLSKTKDAAVKERLVAEYMPSVEVPDVKGIQIRHKKVVHITMASDVPQQYWQLNMDHIEQELKLGGTVPGAELIEEETIAIYEGDAE